jgi:hypothetical protein
LAACGGGGSSAKPGAFGTTTADATAAQTYGYGPSADTHGHLQSDVVVVGGGPGAIRSASDDGLTWTIDRRAPGASDLRVGAVMLMTSHAAGRVAVMRDQGDDRIVTLAPVQLSDILRDGTISYNNDVRLDSVVYQEVPARPGAVSPTESGGTGSGGAGAPSSTTQPPGGTAAGVVGLPPVHLVAAVHEVGAPRRGTLPPARSTSAEVPIGDWTAKASSDNGQLSLSVVRDVGGGLKVGVNLGFVTDNLHIDTNATDQGGKTTGFKFVMQGLKGFTVSIQAGAERGGLDNSKLKVELPVDIDVPIPPSPATAGLPLDVKFGFKFAIETALTGNNSTLFASGEYGLSGPLGIENGQILTPSFSVKKSIIDSIGGITLGPSGIVVAVSLKTLVGLGIPAAAMGPYTSVTTSVGVTNGSSLGAALARCHGASLDIDVAGGVSLSISAEADQVLQILLPKGTKLETGLEVKKNVLHRAQVVPDVPLCNQGTG